MNQKQREYLTSRIDDIARKKKSEITDRFTVKGKVDSDELKWKLVLSGLAKPRKNIEHGSGYYVHSFRLSELYDFLKWEDKIDQKNLDKALAKLTKESRRVYDLAMLGDCEQAVKLLGEFESFNIKD